MSRTRYYEQRHGSLYLLEPSALPKGEPKILRMVDRASELAFTFDRDSGSLLKHGPKSDVEEWTRQYLTLFPGQNLATVSFSDDVDVAELNKALSTAGYINELVKKLQAPLTP